MRPRTTRAAYADFADFCKQASNPQILRIYANERKARRTGYARIAKEEAIRRGLEKDLPK